MTRPQLHSPTAGNSAAGSNGAAAVTAGDAQLDGEANKLQQAQWQQQQEAASLQQDNATLQAAQGAGSKTCDTWVAETAADSPVTCLYQACGHCGTVLGKSLMLPYRYSKHCSMQLQVLLQSRCKTANLGVVLCECCCCVLGLLGHCSHYILTMDWAVFSSLLISFSLIPCPSISHAVRYSPQAAKHGSQVKQCAAKQ